jgi:hypothetical protein
MDKPHPDSHLQSDFDPVSAIRRSRVHMPLPALGALLGGVIAFIATGIVLESLIVLLSATIGWAIGVGAAFWIDRERRRTEADKASDPGLLAEQRTRDELYQSAQLLDIEGRSEMTKDQLAEAVAERTARADSRA